MLMRPAAAMARLMLILSVAVIAAGFLAVGQRLPTLLWLGGGWLAWSRVRKIAPLTSHGSSRLAWFFDLLGNGMLGRSGLILGRVGAARGPSPGQAVALLLDPRVGSDLACQAVLSVFNARRWIAERMIRINIFTYLLTVAPAGKGKSVSVLVPNLLSYKGSVVCIDPKAELWSLTSRARERLGHRVFVLDPGGLCRRQGGRPRVSDRFNPLDFIPADDPDLLTKCRDLANMLVVRKGTETDPFWDDAAELMLAAFISFVAACEKNPEIRNLTTVRRLLSSKTAYLKALEVMKKTEGFGGVIAIQGKLAQWFADRTLDSVMATVQRHTAWLDAPQVAACLSSTTFDPRLLRTGKVTAYFVLSHDKLTVLQGLMRLWLGSTIRVATQGTATEANPVLFLVDEAGHIGNMRALQDGITLMRGMGIRIWLFFQSLGQLRACYGEHADIIMDNMDTQQYFGTNSFSTAEAISKRIGEQTIRVTTDSGGTGDSYPVGGMGREPQPGSRSSNRGWSVAPTGRAVIQPSEVLVLPEDTALIFHRNLPCIPAKLLKYYEAKEFRNGGNGDQAGGGPGTLLAAAAVLLISLVLAAGAVGGLPRPSRLAGYLPGLPVGGGGGDRDAWAGEYRPLEIPDPPLPPPPPPANRRPERSGFHSGLPPHRGY